MAVKKRIEILLDKLNVGIFEKKEVMALALLSSIAGESIFMLGPPGVAKSLIARRLKYAYKDAKVFEYLMSRFSTPDEIFGPVSIKKLKEDKYERIVENYLPSSEVVFLDEIWKAGPSIQNALLTVINEKKFRNGEKEIDIPMKVLISASNELPAKNQGVEALWDRFLIRLVVLGIEDNDNFKKMISEKLNAYEDNINTNDKITNSEHAEWNKEIDNITIPDNVFNVIHFTRAYIATHNEKEENPGKGIYVSDRRWRKVVRLLRTSAFLNSRNEVDLMDCFLIRHCIWNEEEQIETTYAFVRDAIEKHGYTVDFDFKLIEEEIEGFKVEIDEETRFIKNTRVEELALVAYDGDNYYAVQGATRDDYYTGHKPVAILLQEDHYKQLSAIDLSIDLFYHSSYYGRVESHKMFNIRKGKDKYHVVIDNKEYKLETEIRGDKRQVTKKPHHAVEEQWDQRIDNFLSITGGMKEKIEKYRTKDLDHLRKNIFVDPVLANIVESHITETIKTIEKIDVEVRQIQGWYKKLKNTEVIINDSEDVPNG